MEQRRKSNKYVRRKTLFNQTLNININNAINIITLTRILNENYMHTRTRARDTTNQFSKFLEIIFTPNNNV